MVLSAFTALHFLESFLTNQLRYLKIVTLHILVFYEEFENEKRMGKKVESESWIFRTKMFYSSKFPKIFLSYFGNGMEK